MIKIMHELIFTIVRMLWMILIDGRFAALLMLLTAEDLEMARYKAKEEFSNEIDSNKQ